MDGHGLQLSFPGTLDGFGYAFGKLQQALRRDGLDPATRYRVELMFEEIVTNIIRHGSPDGGPLAVRMSLDVGDEAIVLTFDDDGLPFDPRVHPRTPNALETSCFGLILIHHAATHLDYQRTAEQTNRLVVTLPATGKGASG